MAETTLASAMFEYHFARATFEDAMVDAGFGDFEKIGGDHYDNSIEFCGVGNDARMNDAAQRIVFDAGFATAYVNHKDGWETHYTWNRMEPFKAVRGWRRKRVEKGFLISYLPEQWGKQGGEWVASGYMTVVPDPLENTVATALDAALKGTP